ISRRIGNHLVWDSGDEQQIRSDAQGWHLWLQIAPTTQPSTSTVPVLGGNEQAERPRHVELADLERRLTAQIEQRPEKWNLLVRGEFYARSGRFNKAADDYAAALRFDSSSHYWDWLQSVSINLQA